MLVDVDGRAEYRRFASLEEARALRPLGYVVWGTQPESWDNWHYRPRETGVRTPLGYREADGTWTLSPMWEGILEERRAKGGGA